MAIFKPEPNVPATITLKYKSAKEKSGQYGMQYLYTLENGDALFVPPVAHAEIQSLNPAPGEPFVLLAKSEGNRITWSVERVPAPGPTLVKAGKSKAELMNDLGNVLVNGQAKPATNGVNRFYLERAVRLIDVFAEANKYAAEHHNGAVTKDDVRALVTTVFIQCTPKPQANGTR